MEAVVDDERTMLVDDDDDSFRNFLRDGASVRHHHDINATSITSTVVIRVTPREDHMISWACLWVGFFLACILASWQVYCEHRTFKARVAADVEHGGAEALSSADRTRWTFRRLLLLAMLARLISIPVMIWADPLWFQFVGDTLPEMIFATAWTLMVTFFVQLVGSATGIVTNTDASVVIQVTAYIVYTCLIVLELFNSVASVLLYALLCCIYAALLGSMAYFFPRLVTLLRPSMENHRTLVLRLYLCTFVCLGVFCGHVVVFASVVIAAPQKVYWWSNYGLLELIPSVVFLFLMNPSQNRPDRNSSDMPTDEAGKRSTPNSGTGSGSGIRRADSVGSTSSNPNNNNNHKRASSSAETTLLMKPSPSYGSAAGSN